MQVRGTWPRGRPTAWVSYARSSGGLVGVVEHVIPPPRLLDDDSSQGGRGRGAPRGGGAGGEPLEDEVLGGEPLQGVAARKSAPSPT